MNNNIKKKKKKKKSSKIVSSRRDQKPKAARRRRILPFALHCYCTAGRAGTARAILDVDSMLGAAAAAAATSAPLAGSPRSLPGAFPTASRSPPRPPRHQTMPRAAAPAPAGGAVAPAPGGAAPPPAAAAADSTLLAVERVGDALVAGGVELLAGLPACARLVADAATGAAVFGLEAGAPTAQFDAIIGALAPGRLLALGRTSLWWMTPAWGAAAADVPPETQFLLVEVRGALDGEESAAAAGPVYALFLPLIDAGAFRATLGPPPGGRAAGPRTLGLRVESGAADVAAASFAGALLVAAGREPFALVRAGVAAAAARSGGAPPREAKAAPPTVDLFGWCTWVSRLFILYYYLLLFVCFFLLLLPSDTRF
jgi:hypothetical protein